MDALNGSARSWLMNPESSGERGIDTCQARAIPIDINLSHISINWMESF